MVKENGHWKCCVFNGRVGVESDDFEHDVILFVNGDFYDLEQRKDYAREIAKRLNAYQGREEL